MIFKKVNPKQNFFELEQEILKWWKEKNILNKSIENRDPSKTKIFYDGPITANGKPHHGHMLTFVMKDIIPRYWTMKGYRINRSLGWDCHGLPVEYEIEKQLGFKEKKDIEKFGIEKFNKLCRESVEKHKEDIIKLEEMSGRLTNDWEEYSTMDPNYIESIWWSLKELYQKGILYEGFKVVPYSTRAGTTLSNAEVALGGYKKIVDPAITVKFKLIDIPDTFMLAWTTTPWTIPSNLALAVGKDIKYVEVELFNQKERYILAEDLLQQVLKGENYKVINKYNGLELVGIRYIPPFEYFYDENNSNKHKVYEGFHVNTESGTGIVHLAPYGIEDQEIFKNVGIESFDVLDEQGDFNEYIKELQGINYKNANPIIIQKLKERNLLFSYEEYEHDMPICWRTNTPLIYKPINSWFIKMSSFRNKLVELNNKINWIPEHIKEGRFGNWLAEIKDWNISRKRYWGTPMPIWKSESGKILFIGSFEELFKLSKQKVENFDPHRPFIDEITIKYENEIYRRIPDVLDVWYDSGAMPFARLHYPFENKDSFEKKFPADYISESIDQTRGWFYSLHAISTTLFNSIAYKNIVVTGHILGEDGTKLSKSKKNYTPPEELIKEFGADTIRLEFLSSPITYGESAIVSKETLKIQKQEMILPLWNIYTYITIYANLHNYEVKENMVKNDRYSKEEFSMWNHIPFDEIENELDLWLITLLQKTILQVNQNLEKYEFSKAYKEIKNLITNISKWYIRRSRERFVHGDISALNTTFYVFIETLKLLAPFAPFITEYIYKELVGEHTNNLPDSIHLCDYPEHDQKFLEENEFILKEMEIVRSICEMGLSIRTNQNIKLKQPLEKIQIKSNNEIINTFSGWIEEIILDELNIKALEEVIEIDESSNGDTLTNSDLKISIKIELKISDELKQEGILREIIRFIQSERKTLGLEANNSININYYTNSENIKVLISKNIEEIKKRTNCSNLYNVEENVLTNNKKKLEINENEFLLILINKQ